MSLPTFNIDLMNDSVLGVHRYQLESNGRLVFIGANSAADQILKIDHASLIGKPIEDAFPGLAGTTIPDQYRNVAQTGEIWQDVKTLYEYGQISAAFSVQALQTAPGQMAAIFLNLNEQKKKELSLEKRDAIFLAIAYAAEQFLRTRDWRTQIQGVLEQLGKASEASQIGLCEIRMEANGDFVSHLRHIWQAEHFLESHPAAWLTDFDFEARGFGRWAGALAKGELVHGLLVDFPETERQLLEVQGIFSTAVAPIFINHAWWGLLFLDNLTSERSLSDAEVEALKAAANTIGAAIQRSQSDLNIRENSARAQILVQAAARLSANLDLESVVNVICSEVAQVLKAEAVNLYLHNEENKALESAGGYNLPGDWTNLAEPIPVSKLNVFLQKYGVPLILKDQASIAAFFGAPFANLVSSRSIVTWLIIFNQKLSGILNIHFNDTGRSLGGEELVFLEGLVNQSAMAIHNAMLYASEQARTRQLSVLYDLSVNLNTSQNIDKTLNHTIASLQELLDAEGSLAVMRNEAGTTLSIPLAKGYLESNQGRSMALWENWSNLTSTQNKPYISRGLDSEIRLFPGLEGIQETGPAIILPLISEQEPVGVLLFGRKKTAAVRPFAPLDMRLLGAIGDLVGTTLRKAQLSEESQRRLTFLQSLRAIDVEISSSLNLATTLHVVLDEVITQLNVNAVDVLVVNPQSNMLELTSYLGFKDEAILRAYLSGGEGFADLVAYGGHMVFFPDLSSLQNQLSQSKLFLLEKFNAYAAVPLFAKGKVKGVMEVYQRNRLDPSQEWLEFLETLAGQTAIAIESISLFHNLEGSNAELLAAYDATIEGWSSALDLRDADTEGHTLRVTQLTEYLAQAMGLRGDDLLQVRRGALLHDIGKMGVPDQILHKPGPLTDQEWVIMRKHPEYAYKWLWPTAYLRPALDIPYCHHEKWDGTGYPRGLKEEEIPLKARIFSVIDVWDALSSDRPYRSKWPQDKVENYIRDQSGTFFDPKIVPVFMEILNDQDFVQ